MTDALPPDSEDPRERAGFWIKQQQEANENFNRGMEVVWASRLEFWRHLMTIEATVLALTIGLIGITSSAYSTPLVFSWIALLLAIIVGGVLIKISLDVEADQKFFGFRSAYDLAGIQAQVESGELEKGSEKYKGMVIAAAQGFRTVGGPDIPWTEMAKQHYAKYKSELPSNIFNEPKRSKPTLWLFRHRGGLEEYFYTFTAVAFVMLLFSIAGPWRGSSDQSRALTKAPVGSSKIVPKPETQKDSTQVTPEKKNRATSQHRVHARRTSPAHR